MGDLFPKTGVGSPPDPGTMGDLFLKTGGGSLPVPKNEW